MGPDYSFFALLLVLAQALAPAGAQQLSWINGDHPEQAIVFQRADARWELTVNGRPLGVLTRSGAEVVLRQEGGEPERFAVGALLAPLAPRARRATLRGRFAPAELVIERSAGQLRVRDPSGTVLGTSLTLRSR